MKIQSVDNRFLIKNYNNSNFSCPVSLIAKDSVSFSGLFEKGIKIQAKYLNQDANSTYKEASETREYSYVVLADASDFQEEAMQIKENSSVVYLKAKELLNLGRNTNFEPVINPLNNEITREYYDGDDGQLIIEEYDEAGKTSRKIIFDRQVVMVMERNPETRKMDSYIFDVDNGEIIQFAKDIKINLDGYEASKQFMFQDGKITSCDIKHKVVDEKYEKSKTHYSYHDGNLASYSINWQYNNDGVEKSEENYTFVKGQLRKVFYGLVDSFEEERTAQAEYIYGIDGELTSCILDVVMKKDGNNTIGTMYKYGENGLQKAYLDIEALPKERKMTAKKLFFYDDDEPLRCLCEYEFSKNGKEKFSKAVNLKD
ncbi:MAG: hypothetical protein IJB79_05145 [Candidatus Gastranaerophilales bacterium]|nr:hypothetical protein [Candidatus Gastranaerophilales bacterium]